MKFHQILAVYGMQKRMQKLDKDVFRRDLGNLTDAYEIILAKLGGQTTCIKLKYLSH